MYSSFAIDTHLLTQERAPVFNNALSPNPAGNFILDTSSDGILEIMAPAFSEPEPFLLSSDDDEIDSMPRWAMSYTPYISTGECKTPHEIKTDAISIASKGFRAIRLFSTDCDVLPSLEDVTSERSLSIIPTIYIPEDGINESVEEQLADLLSFGRWDVISMVAIGSEAVHSGFCTAEQLGEFIGNSTTRLRFAGYSGPVTTIEHPGVIRQNAKALCPHLHILTSSAQPYLESTTKARDTGRYMVHHLKQLAESCGDSRDAYVLEAGWPRKGKPNGLAVAGQREQRIAIQEMLRVAGSRIALSTFEDELWREPGQLSAEQFWGCGHVFRAIS